jgi:hypothetical protein
MHAFTPRWRDTGAARLLRQPGPRSFSGVCRVLRRLSEVEAAAPAARRPAGSGVCAPFARRFVAREGAFCIGGPERSARPWHT